MGPPYMGPPLGFPNSSYRSFQVPGPPKGLKIMDPILPRLFLLGYWAFAFEHFWRSRWYAARLRCKVFFERTGHGLGCTCVWSFEL